MHDEYGPASILCELDGHGETKFVHAPHGCQSRMFDLIGSYTLQTRQPDSWEGWYWGAKHMWGMDPLGQNSQMNNVIRDVAQNGDAVLFWGCDVETTPLGWGGYLASRLCYWFTELGIKQIHICLLYTSISRCCAVDSTRTSNAGSAPRARTTGAIFTASGRVPNATRARTGSSMPAVLPFRGIARTPRAARRPSGKRRGRPLRTGPVRALCVMQGAV